MLSISLINSLEIAPDPNSNLQPSMGSQNQFIAGERELHREPSIQFVYSLPLSEESKGDSEEELSRNWSQHDLRHLDLEASNQFRHVVRRSQRLERRAETDIGPRTKRSVEGRKKAASPFDVGLDTTECNKLKVSHPASSDFPAKLSTSQEMNLMWTPKIPTIALSVDKQPPAEVRTGYVLPAIVASLERSRTDSIEGELTFDDNSLWGQASLVCAGGRVAMAQFRANILTGDSLVAPLLQKPLQMSDKEYWSLTFTGLVVHEPGYFRIHIALIGTSQNGREGHANSAVDAPTEQLSVETSLFRVHAFALAFGDTSEHLPLCSLDLSEQRN